jgi:predicted transcriptional regulator
MSLKNKINPTESELEILQILWEFGPSSVRFINDKQNEKKEVGYTTTLKIMQIMVDKKILNVNKDNRQHVYSSAIDESETKNNLLDGFLKKTFSGSAMKMVMQALGNHNPSHDELEEIKNLINEIENKNS